MGACIVIHKSKPIGCTPPRVNLNTNYGLKVMMMCQGRFISCIKCTILMGDVEDGEAAHLWEQGLCEKSLHLLLNFTVNLNCSKKIES